MIQGWLGPNVLKYPMIARAVGERSMEDAMKNYERHRSLYVEFSPIHHVDANEFLKAKLLSSLPTKRP